MGAPLSLAVCSNRPENLAGVQRLRSNTAASDEVILVADLDPDAATAHLLLDLEECGVRVLRNGANKGLSFSRNRALEVCSHRHLVYVDDDLELPSLTVEAIREAIEDGASIVGVWLEPAFGGRVPWWLTGGQYHYLGVHHNVGQAKSWGACMAIDAHLAREASITFRHELGRRGTGLQSGDDTTFLSELRALGATERFLTDAVAIHHITPARARFGYLLRRAWWQGRSEVRRTAARQSVTKELRRGISHGPAAAGPFRRYPLAALYLTAVICGIAMESVLQAAHRRS